MNGNKMKIKRIYSSESCLYFVKFNIIDKKFTNLNMSIIVRMSGRVFVV